MPIDPHHLRGFETPLVIESDRSCRNCSYPLRGLPVQGTCPECGTSIRGTRIDDRSVLDLGWSLRLPVAIGVWITLVGTLFMLCTAFFPGMKFAPFTASVGLFSFLLAGLVFLQIPNHPAARHALLGWKRWGAVLRILSPIGAGLAALVPLAWSDLVGSTRSLIACQFLVCVLLYPFMCQLINVADWMREKTAALLVAAFLAYALISQLYLFVWDAYGMIPIPIFGMAPIDMRIIAALLMVGGLLLLSLGALNMLLAHGPRDRD